MPSNSITSSMEARNGSNYSQSHADLSSHIPPAGVICQTARWPTGIRHRQSTTMTEQLNGGSQAGTQDHQGIHDDQYGYTESEVCSYTNGDYSQTASTYENDSTNNQQSESQWDSQSYYQHGDYYLSVSPYQSVEAQTYDNELAIEEEQYGSGDGQGAGSESQGIQQPSEASTYPHQNGRPSNIAGTPTTRRWSREYSPEERMRLGLPRWESEQQRLEYERRQRRQGRHRS